MVWMMHRKNFTLNPYIGETGTLQPALRASGHKTQNGKTSNDPDIILAWEMSSQVKFGRDALPYAMHQLHRRPLSSFALVSENDGATAPTRPSSTYVAPTLVIRKDLRFLKDAARTGDHRKHGTFIEDLERTLTDPSQKVALELSDANKRGVDLGLFVEHGSPEFRHAAHSMNLAWSSNINTKTAAQKILSTLNFRLKVKDKGARQVLEAGPEKGRKRRAHTRGAKSPINVAHK